MRVVILIAGAGGMYCGSCLRDNRLAATLRESGKDVVLLPLYTPIRTDEEDVSEPTVHYGGINVFLQQKVGLFRRTPRVVDRLLDSPGLLRGVGKLAASTTPKTLGELTVSVLRGAAGAQRKELLRLIETLQAIEPDVVLLPNLMFVGMAESLKGNLRVRVGCSLAGEDIFLDALPEPHRTATFDLIRRAASHVDAFAAPTRYYADHAAQHFQLPADRIHYVPLGIRVEDFNGPARRNDEATKGWGSEPGARATGHGRNDELTIGYLARICPEKGLANLARAFAALRREGRKCRLIAAGYRGPGDRQYLEEIRRFLREQGVDEAFQDAGEVTREEKIGLLKSFDVFCVPTVYREPKGLYVLEAMAAGVPVILPKHGSFPELVEPGPAGLLYEPEDEKGLIAALRRLMDDPGLRHQLGATGHAAAGARYTDRIMSERMWHLFEQLNERGGVAIDRHA